MSSATVGGSSWSGNPPLATLRQLLSTSEGLANTGDSNFDAANISTLYVSTISGLNFGTQTLNILNTSSIQISTFRNININGSNLTLRSQNAGQILNNGTMLLDNTDPITGRSATNITNIFCGEGSFQALAGNMTIGASDTLNLYGGDKVSLTTAWSQNNYPNGVFDIAGNNLLGVRSLSTINISTGTITANNIFVNSLSSIYVSTGNLRALNADFDSLSSLRISTGSARVGVADIGTLTVGGVALSGALDMCNNNINNVATLTATTANIGTVGATSVNATNISGTLTGNVTGNVSGNLTGNVTGNIYNPTLTVGAQYSITETADVGSALANWGNYGTVNISAKGGLGGIVNITADVATPLNPALTVSQMTLESKGNYGVFVITPPDPYLGYIPRGGLVQIIARQGLTPTPPATVTSGLFANGEIDLTAYSYGTVPGLIKMSAGANSMYAGPISPITGIIGTNNIYGTVANTITAGTPPGVIPTFAGTNYLYGFNGTSIQNTLYVDNILNYGNGVTYSNLTIGANNSKDVLISNVKTIDGANTGTLQSFLNMNSSNLNVYKQAYISSLTVDDIVFNRLTENFDNLFASTIFTSTITGFNNGTQAVNLINFSNINISTGTTINTKSGLSTIVNAGTSAYITAPTTTITSGTAVNLNTPIVKNQTHLDSPSISTLNFQATNFLATTVTVANTTITQLTVPLINGNPDMSISTSVLNIQAAGVSPGPTTNSYVYTGADQTFTVPAGVFSITIISMKGGGGGGNTSGTYSTPGKGGLVSGTLAVTPGETLTLVVGGGGGNNPTNTTTYGGGGSGNNSSQNGTNGGGRTAIRRAGVDIVVAGGGGGSAAISAFSDNDAGDGGGTNGEDGGGTDHSGSAGGPTGGTGGTQLSVGLGGFGFPSPASAGNNAVLSTGGSSSYQAGSGGGGWFGGGGGGYSVNDLSSAGGGGGGSSYVANLTGTVVNTQGGGALVTKPGTLSFSYTAVPPGTINTLADITSIQCSDTFNVSTNITNITSLSQYNVKTVLADINTSTLTLGGGLYTNVSTFTARRIRCITVDTGGGDFWDSTGVLYANTTGVANFTNSDSPTGGFEYACYDAVFTLSGFDGTLDAYNLQITQVKVTGAVNGSNNWYAACSAKAMPGVVGPPPTLHTKWFVTGIFFPKTLGAN